MSVPAASIAGQAWLNEPSLRRLLEALGAGGEEARLAGGAVRNALLGEPIADIDIATTALPDEVVRRVEAADFKAVPTGIDHGTITVVAEGKPYEVTTLRHDVDTDGRRATVEFGRDWTRDAERRDFTINALYADADGAVVDLVGGLADLRTRTIRFIGDADQRIREDYLRILRFFRFFAWYGHGRPDAEGLKASARLKDGLDQLSAERVWSELKKLLSAPDPSRALLWMRQAGILTKVLPESEKWGIDAIHGLVAAEKDLSWRVDPMLRLAAIVPPDAPRLKDMALRLRFSTSETERILAWASSMPAKPKSVDADLRSALYFGEPQGIRDRLQLALASARTNAVTSNDALVDAAGLTRQLRMAESWTKPVLPVKGADLVARGIPQGPQIGKTLAILEKRWVESGFVLGRDELLSDAIVT